MRPFLFSRLAKVGFATSVRCRMAEPLTLVEPDEKPVTTRRMIIIAALVALVIGCLPSLFTALAVQSNLQDQVNTICNSRMTATIQSNKRLASDRINLKGDITILKATVKGASGDFLGTINASIASKESLISKSHALPIPHCQ